MDIGKDCKGRSVHFRDALIEETYRCPECTEKLNLRGGKTACFAHNIIKERTPAQRICPNYHENENYKKISNIVDIIYINNGGITLYLCNDGNKFELRAYFANIKETYRNQLIDNKTKIFINKKKWCGVEDLSFYPLHDIKKWIYIDTVPKTTIDEVKRKWLYGIRGIDIENDIYKGTNDGGYRIAIKSNIYIGKKYKILCLKDKIFICGIKFKCIGQIRLIDNGNKKIFNIFDMEIFEITEESREFIEGKGYQLVKKLNKIIPLWPPVVFKGNDLILDNDAIWFYHLIRGADECLYEIIEGKIRKLAKNKLFKIFSISKFSEKVIVISNKSILEEELSGTVTEIKYILNYIENLNFRKTLERKIIIKDIYNEIIDYSLNSSCIPKDGKLIIDSNIPILARVMRNNYCIYSSKYNLDEIIYGDTIFIDCKCFENIDYKYNEILVKSDKIESINWKTLSLKLYNCRGILVKPTYNDKKLLYKLQKNLNNENKIIFKILYNWILNNGIPINSQKILNEVEENM